MLQRLVEGPGAGSKQRVLGLEALDLLPVMEVLSAQAVGACRERGLCDHRASQKGNQSAAADDRQDCGGAYPHQRQPGEGTPRGEEVPLWRLCYSTTIASRI